MANTLKYENPINVTKLTVDNKGRLYIPKKVLKEANLLNTYGKLLTATDFFETPDLHLIDARLKHINGWEHMKNYDFTNNSHMRFGVKVLFNAKPGDKFTVEVYNRELTIYADHDRMNED